MVSGNAASSARANSWKSNYDSSRKFKPEWQNRFSWVKKAVDGSADAHCSLCQANITPRLSNLKGNGNKNFYRLI